MTGSQAGEDRADLYAEALTSIAKLVVQARALPRGERPPFIDQIADVLDTLGAQLIKESVAA